MRVPFTTRFPEGTSWINPALAGAVTVRLLNVVVAVEESPIDFATVPVKETL